MESVQFKEKVNHTPRHYAERDVFFDFDPDGHKDITMPAASNLFLFLTGEL